LGSTFLYIYGRIGLLYDCSVVERAPAPEKPEAGAATSSTAATAAEGTAAEEPGC